MRRERDIKMRRLNVWLSTYANSHPLRLALLVGVLGGVANVAVDFDHIWKPSRTWHIPLAIVAGFVAIYCVARLRRLSSRVVLGGQR